MILCSLCLRLFPHHCEKRDTSLGLKKQHTVSLFDTVVRRGERGPKKRRNIQERKISTDVSIIVSTTLKERFPVCITVIAVNYSYSRISGSLPDRC